MRDIKVMKDNFYIYKTQLTIKSTSIKSSVIWNNIYNILKEIWNNIGGWDVPRILQEYRYVKPIE
ncbi:hypothetical protein X975_18748, partial [Stegodyphus mimosarum]